MRYPLIACLLAMLTIAHSGCAPTQSTPAHDGPSKIIPIASADQLKTMLASDQVVLIDFWADWCAPCHQLKPTIEKIAHDYEGRVAVLSIDVEALGEVASHYGIESIPTVIIFKNGELVDRFIGLRDEATYTHVLQRIAPAAPPEPPATPEPPEPTEEPG